MENKTEKMKLHPGVKWAWRIGFYILTLFGVLWLSIAAIPLLMVFSPSYGLIVLLILLVGIFITEAYIGLAYNNWSYELTKDGVKLERGVIWKRYSNIPYSRIQNVDITRGVVARVIGFSTVDIQTAGYSGYGRRPGMSEGHIPAVDVEEAEKMRDFLVKKIGHKGM